MGCSIEIRYHPIYELLNSLLIFSNPSFYKKTEIGVQWRKSVLKRLSPGLAEQLNSSSVDQMGVLYGYIFTQNKTDITIDSYLEDLLNTDMKDILEYYQNQLHVKLELTELNDGGLEPAIQIIKKWKLEYFDQLDPTILNALENDFFQKKQQLPGYESFDFVEKVTKGFVLKDFEDLKQIILYPSYHTNPIVAFSHYPKMHMYGYPIDLPPSSPEDPSPSLLQKGVALSDKNRLKILRFLGKEEKNFTEIVKYIGLAKSTVHHHMVLLRASGLVQIIITPNSTNRYRLREQGFENIHQDYYQYLFSPQL